MAVRKAMIEDQLAAVANAMRTINSPSRDLDDFSLKILMVSWANFSRRSRDEKARERAWRAACSERLKSKSVVQWRIWARCGRMAMMAELASREGMAEARRLSRALHRFRASCVRLRQERHLSVAVQVLCTATQIRPMERLWSRWRRVVRHCQSKAVFKAWTTVMRRRRRLQDAKQRVVTAKDRRTALNILTAWRKKTGASMLAELSNAWATIGPVRKAVSIMRGMATEVRAEKYRRRRRLRKGLTDGFIPRLTGRHRLLSASSRGREHNRKRRLQAGFGTFHHNVTATALRIRARERAAGEYRRQMLLKGIHRWLARYRLAVLVITGKHRLSIQKKHASICTWARQTEISRATRTLGKTRERRTLASCVMRWKEYVVRMTTKHTASATAATTLRSSRLRRGVRCWKSRACSRQRRRLLESVLSTFAQLRYFRLGLASLSRWALGAPLVRHTLRKRRLRTQADAIARWLEAVRTTHAIRKAVSHRHIRRLSSTLLCWRNRACQSREQHRIEQVADFLSRQHSLTAGVGLWQRRVRHVSGMYAIVSDFQLRRRHRLGLFALHQWMEKQKATRLVAWRARVWAGGFCAANALKRWRSRAQRKREIEVSVRLAEGRRNASTAARCYHLALVRRVFVALSGHARTRQLERRVLAAWSIHTQRMVQADKQVRALRLRSGLRCLSSGVKSFHHWRDYRLRASDYRTRKMKQTTFGAWKNAIYPLGLRVQWKPSKGASPARTMDDRGVRTRANDGRLSQRTARGEEGLEPTKEAIGRSNSLVLLRLPMVGKWMRRVLYEWRNLSIKGKRLRYIRDMLPQKMGRVPSASSQASATGEDSRVRNVSYQAPPEVVQTLMAGSESGLGAAFGTQTDVGRDQASASHGKPCGPCSLQAGAGDVLNSSGRRQPTDARHQGNRANFTVDPTNLGAGKVTGGSYLQLHLLHSGGKKASATRWH